MRPSSNQRTLPLLHEISAASTQTKQAFDNSSSREQQFEQHLEDDKTPVKPRRRNRKPFVLVAIALLIMAVFGGVVYALPVLTGKAATEKMVPLGQARQLPA